MFIPEVKSLIWAQPANLHTKICLKMKDKKLKICYLFWKNLILSESAKRELTVFCDGLPRTYLVSSMPGRSLTGYLMPV
jgi:hypothetical protein